METNVQEELCQDEMPNFGVSEIARLSLPSEIGWFWDTALVFQRQSSQEPVWARGLRTPENLGIWV